MPSKSSAETKPPTEAVPQAGRDSPAPEQAGKTGRGGWSGLVRSMMPGLSKCRIPLRAEVAGPVGSESVLGQQRVQSPDSGDLVRRIGSNGDPSRGSNRKKGVSSSSVALAAPEGIKSALGEMGKQGSLGRMRRVFWAEELGPVGAVPVRGRDSNRLCSHGENTLDSTDPPPGVLAAARGCRVVLGGRLAGILRRSGPRGVGSGGAGSRIDGWLPAAGSRSLDRGSGRSVGR